MHKAGYVPRNDATERRRSWALIIKAVLKAWRDDPDHIQEKTVKEFLGVALGWLTESEGKDKHQTRYYSKAALAGNGKLKLNHDHVYTKKIVVPALLIASEDELDTILDIQIGCTVTLDEHDVLNQYSDHDGWERYRRAIADGKLSPIYHGLTGKPADLTFSLGHSEEVRD